jgi:hypothetical protein
MFLACKEMLKSSQSIDLIMVSFDADTKADSCKDIVAVSLTRLYRLGFHVILEYMLKMQRSCYLECVIVLVQGREHDGLRQMGKYRQLTLEIVRFRRCDRGPAPASHIS